MGRGSDLFRYSGMANPDITSGANMILSGLGTPGELADKATAKQRVEMQDLRQAKADAMATPGTPEWLAAKEAEKALKMDSMAAEQKWKAEFDPVYQNALAVQKQSIVGSPEYNEAQKTLTKLEQDKKWFDWNNNPETKAKLDEINRLKTERAGQELLAKAIVGIPTEKMTSTTITPEQVQQTRVGLESAAVTNAGDVYNREFAKLRSPSEGETVTLGNGETITLAPGKIMSAEEAHQEALKIAGLLDVVAGNAPKIDEKSLPKAGTIEKKVKLTPEELVQAKIDATIKAVKDGKVPATLGMEVISKLTPVKTQKEKLEEAKYDLDVEEFKAKKEGGMFKKSANGGGTGDWIKTYDAMIKTYGDPGSLDRANIEKKLSDLQSAGYSDKEMASAIEAARGTYGSAWIGVDEDGFINSVQKSLQKIK